MINQRLFEQYHIDTAKDLAIPTRCARPFDTLLVDSWGSCFVCECQAWLPQSVGNLHRNSIPEILNSTMTQEMQASVSDGTYRYCNNHQCMYIKKGDIRPVTMGRSLQHLRLAIDDSCNLSCPSCRQSQIFLKSGKMFNMRMQLVDRLIQFLEQRADPLKIHIGSDGDPFASLIYRRFMRRVPDLDNLTYSFQTNGLLVKQMYPRVQNIFEKLHTLNISIDGASKDTYETLRRGGSWKKIMENLQFISGLKHKHNFKLALHMVVQSQNWHEMMDMCELGSSIGADEVVLNKIEDWQTYGNFDQQRVPDTADVHSLMEQVDTHPLSITWTALR
jgi:sulfatase maturation enzyme AslB (radical SAM superfamily)